MTSLGKVHLLSFPILLILIESISIGCHANRIAKTTINVTSSDSHRVKILNFSIDQNAAVNLSYEFVKPWDRVLVIFKFFILRKVSKCNFLISVKLFNNLQNCKRRKNPKTYRHRKTGLLCICC